MIILTPFGAFGSLVCRDARGRFCSAPPAWRAMWAETRRRQQAAERRSRLSAGSLLHRELGSDHPERAPRLQTPGQVAWIRRNVTPWMEV